MKTRARPGEAAATFVRLLASDSDRCVIWPHSLTAKGYGQLAVHGVTKLVHALACEHHHGPRPPGTQAAHSCGVNACLNGRHLRWATPAANEDDKRLHGTHRRRGPGRRFTSENALSIRGLA